MLPLDPVDGRVVRAGHGTELGDLHLVSVDDILDCIHVLVLDERIQGISRVDAAHAY
ncbi:MAG: hypothetical protein JJD98_10025 [Polaromonas sp.]|nr:hypothetical protein [Polaromonas sp.]